MVTLWVVIDGNRYRVQAETEAKAKALAAQMARANR